MDHAHFVIAARAGTLAGYLPPKAAADFLSRRLMLPVLALPVLAGGVGLAISGWLLPGVAVFLLGCLGRRAIKRNAPAILLEQALRDERLFRDLVEAGVLQLDA